MENNDNREENPAEDVQEAQLEDPQDINELEAEPVQEAEKAHVEEKPKAQPIADSKLMETITRFGSVFSFKMDWNIRNWPAKIMHTLREYKRVILVSKKPDIDELSEISKISAIGILIIGAIGFILQTLFQFFV